MSTRCLINGEDITLLKKFDGKQKRVKTGVRRIVENQPSMINYLQSRIFQRDHRDRIALQPDPLYNVLMLPPCAYPDTPISSICTRMIRSATNQDKCSITCIRWTPDGKRLITANDFGQLTLWDGRSFNFDSLQTAHQTTQQSVHHGYHKSEAIGAMEWSHNGMWLVSADNQGMIKYWQNNMNCLNTYRIHSVAVRSLAFCPTDTKFVSGSDDNTIKLWDFETSKEERVFQGHGSEVRSVDWNPRLKIIASGSKDSQMPVKLWDVSSGVCLDTIHAHKHPVMAVKFHKDENLLLTASRDNNLMLFDIRKTIEPLHIFRGHRREVLSIAFHPIHHNLFASGAGDGSIYYWLIDKDKMIGGMESAHDGCVWSLDWHPVGNILASGSNDKSTKFWTRNRLGDRMRDKYNLNSFNTPEDNDDDHEGIVGINIDEAIDKEESPVFLIPGVDLPPTLLVPEKDANQTLKRRHDNDGDSVLNDITKLPRN